MGYVMKKHILFVLWALSAAACGSVSNPAADANPGDGSNNVPAGDFSLAVDQTSLSLPISGKADITVNITRSEGMTDAIALTATGLPTGATATFANSSLPDGTSSTTMTVTVDTSADAGTGDITITGKAGELEHSATVSLELHTQTVTGKVRYDAQMITVRLVGKSAVQSDSMGNFTFTDVKVPYDIYVIGQTGTDQNPIPAINYYAGLTRLDPIVTRPSATCAFCLTLLSKSATVNGSRMGTGNNTDPIYGAWTSGGNSVRTDGTWYFTASWFGAFNQNTVSGTLHALQPTRGALNAPTGFHYGVSPTVTLTAGNTHTINVTLASLGTTAALSGTIAQPSGFPMPTVTLSQQLAGSPVEIWSATTTNAASMIPVLANQKASFYAMSTSGGRTSEAVYPNLTASTDVSMTLPPPAGMTGPVNGAANITNSTPFEYTTSDKQVYQVAFRSATATYFVFTTSGSIKIPDVTEMPLPLATAYTWTVTGYGPYSSIDDAAAMDPLLNVAKFEGQGSWHSYTTNPTRSFTTQ